MTLYVVATPIGNLEDVTLRAIRVLREVKLVAAEDTRRTRALLTHLGISATLISYREQNRQVAAERVLMHLAHADAALVSDAGMPAISDPGADLVARAIAAGYRVEVVPGPSAVLTALVGSGLPPAPFTFVGFLSRQRGDRQRYLATLAARPETLVFYEAPHRLRETLRDLMAALGDRDIAVCRELTKKHEETLRGPLNVVSAHFETVAPRGEFTLVVRGASPSAGPATPLDIDARLRLAMERGDDMRRAVADLAAANGQPRRAVYARWQALRRAADGARDGG